jgi:hypothetical protein
MLVSYSKRYLSNTFERAVRSIFPQGRSGYFPSASYAPLAPKPDFPAAMLPPAHYKDQLLHAFACQQKEILHQQQTLLVQQLESQNQHQLSHQHLQNEQLGIMRDMMKSFQETMVTMMGVFTEMMTTQQAGATTMAGGTGSGSSDGVHSIQETHGVKMNDGSPMRYYSRYGRQNQPPLIRVMRNPNTGKLVREEHAA